MGISKRTLEAWFQKAREGKIDIGDAGNDYIDGLSTSRKRGAFIISKRAKLR